MVKKCLLVVLFMPLLAWTAMADDAKTVISNASKAMGADNLKTIQYSGGGFDFALGQAFNGSSPWPKFVDKTYTRTIDFQATASSLSRI